MKMKLLLPLFLLLSLTMFGQSLTLGAVVFSVPVRGAHEFTLMSGLYQNQAQDQAQDQAQFNGFHYGNGTFHLWKNGGSGQCLTGSDPNVPGCRFDGTIGKMTATILDKDCTQISFPITNVELKILNGSGGANDHKPVTALYSQTFRNVHGSLFMAGGTPGSLFAVKKRNREFGITSHFRFWPGARGPSLPGPARRTLKTAVFVRAEPGPTPQDSLRPHRCSEQTPKFRHAETSSGAHRHTSARTRAACLDTTHPAAEPVARHSPAVQEPCRRRTPVPSRHRRPATSRHCCIRVSRLQT